MVKQKYENQQSYYNCTPCFYDIDGNIAVDIIQNIVSKQRVNDNWTQSAAEHYQKIIYRFIV